MLLCLALHTEPIEMEIFFFLRVENVLEQKASSVVKDKCFYHYPFSHKNVSFASSLLEQKWHIHQLFRSKFPD